MISQARMKDIDELVQLEKRAFTEDKLRPFQFRHFLKRKNVLFLKAYTNQHMQGYSLTLLRKGTSVARLYSFAVDPFFQGKGIATKLLRVTEKNTKACGFLKIILEARKDNPRALHFYQKNGYQKFGEYENYYEDGMQALRFLKIL